MVEYVIEVLNRHGDVVALLHQERNGSITTMRPSPEAYSHVSKFRVKARAEKLMHKHRDTYPQARLASTWGGYVYGTKTTVAPFQSKINKRPAYRSM